MNGFKMLSVVPSLPEPFHCTFYPPVCTINLARQFDMQGSLFYTLQVANDVDRAPKDVFYTLSHDAPILELFCGIGTIRRACPVHHQKHGMSKFGSARQYRHCPEGHRIPRTRYIDTYISTKYCLNLITYLGIASGKEHAQCLERRVFSSKDIKNCQDFGFPRLCRLLYARLASLHYIIRVGPDHCGSCMERSISTKTTRTNFRGNSSYTNVRRFPYGTSFGNVANW